MIVSGDLPRVGHDESVNEWSEEEAKAFVVNTETHFCLFSAMAVRAVS